MSHRLKSLDGHPAGNLADRIEQQILRTYVQLAVTPERADGSRRATLARLGAVEVRLTECPHGEGDRPDAPPFWLEIYSHATCSTIDRCGCFEFDEAELATAADLICKCMTMSSKTSVRAS